MSGVIAVLVLQWLAYVPERNVLKVHVIVCVRPQHVCALPFLGRVCFHCVCSRILFVRLSVCLSVSAGLLSCLSCCE